MKITLTQTGGDKLEALLKQAQQSGKESAENRCRLSAERSL